MSEANERGGTAVEYALIATLIAVAIVVALSVIGGSLIPIFEAAAAAF